MSSSRYNFRRNVRQRTAETAEDNNNNNNEVGNNNNGLPEPQPQLVVPPAGNNNNNNQAAIADELAAAAADAAAAPVVDPYAILAQQSNSSRTLVAALLGARNGNGQMISVGPRIYARTDLNNEKLFHIPAFGIFGKVEERGAAGVIKLKCFHSSAISGGTCPAIIYIPAVNGVPNYANFLNLIGKYAYGGDRAHFHGATCPCRNLHQQLNIQNHLMTDLNINAPASVVFPNINNFDTSNTPLECILPNFNVLASLIGQSNCIDNRKLKTLMFKKWRSSLGELFQAIVTSFTGGTLGCSMNDTLHQVIMKVLGLMDSEAMYQNMPLELLSTAGLMLTKTKPLLWDPTDNSSRIGSFNQGLEIKRDTLRLLFVLMHGFIKDMGVVSYLLVYHCPVILLLNISYV